MTITVGGDLSIPGSGTEEFTLEEIMDLEDNSVVKTDAQGNYALNKADTTETDVEIDPVNINAPASNPTTTTLYFNTPAATSEEVEAEVNDVTADGEFRAYALCQPSARQPLARLACRIARLCAPLRP